MARISVIIPSYNTEKYLGRCLNSLVNQTMQDIEIIIIDDNSTDQSLNIASFYQQQYPDKIKIYKTKTNSGAGAARNVGLDVATGEYVGFVDSDDFVAPDYYEKLYSALKETNSELSRSNRKTVLGNVDISFLGRNVFYDNNVVINPKKDSTYLITDPPCVTNKLFKRSLIRDSHFAEGLKWEDYPFAVPLMYKANQVVILPDRNYFYNMHFGNTTIGDIRKLSPKLLDIFTCGDIIEQAIPSSEVSDEIQEELNYLYIQNSIRRLRDVLNAKMPFQEKRELLTMLSNLITAKYGYWQQNPHYLDEKASNVVNGIWMNTAERLLLPEETQPQDEEQLKQLIKTRINPYKK